MAIEEEADKMLKANKPIFRAQQVQVKVQKELELEVGLRFVQKVMRKDLSMGYRLAKSVPIQCNLERCLVLRQQYALQMLPRLEKKMRIINVDESWLNSTHFLRRVWAPSYATCSYPDKQVAPRISLILALDTEGKLWCALTQANTDTDVMTLFLMSSSQAISNLPRKPFETATSASSGHGKNQSIVGAETNPGNRLARSGNFGFRGLMQSIKWISQHTPAECREEREQITKQVEELAASLVSSGETKRWLCNADPATHAISASVNGPLGVHLCGITNFPRRYSKKRRLRVTNYLG